MKKIINPTPPSTFSFEGAVLDPATGRTIASASDIARWLCASPQAVSFIAALGKCRRYGRYLDAEDCLKAREETKARGLGRPRKTGGFTSLGMMASIAGACIMLQAWGPQLNFVAQTANEACQWQEDTVATAEACELPCAVAARAQWDARKGIAQERISALSNLANAGATLNQQEAQ